MFTAQIAINAIAHYIINSIVGPEREWVEWCMSKNDSELLRCSFFFPFNIFPMRLRNILIVNDSNAFSLFIFMAFEHSSSGTRRRGLYTKWT